MTLLYSVAEIRQIEQAAIRSLPPGTLMQRAGMAASTAAIELIGNSFADARVLVLAGPGNNGGDALEAACNLDQAGIQVTLVLCAEDELNTKAADSRRSAEAEQAFKRARSSGVQFASIEFVQGMPAKWDLVIDGLFGIGLSRPITGSSRTLVEIINGFHCTVLALDVPSGLDADTGGIVGPDGIAVRATHTISFIGDKPGLHTGDGRDHSGRITVAPLDIEPEYFTPSNARLNGIQLFSHAFTPRKHNSHKGSFGDVAVVGGAHGMTGAVILAARAAAHCGTGRVFATFVDDAPAYDSEQPELMFRLAQDFDFSAATLVAGPGMGTTRSAHEVLARALNSKTPLVLDADALNLISFEPALQGKVASRTVPTILTPHPLEAGRLSGVSGAAIQANRLAATRELAQRFNAIVVLKGSGTIIARPNGEVVINTTGNPGLATAGTGDVLAGVCGALLAQGCPAAEAAMAAVWLHGRAADMLVARGIGPIGLTASELIPAIRQALNTLVADGISGACA
ncbi:bifunctional ADP-dependent NAD(P)H-hydrate dehydratase/NAD(P)H-hydrate epimerase [soil metagenome]